MSFEASLSTIGPVGQLALTRPVIVIAAVVYNIVRGMMVTVSIFVIPLLVVLCPSVVLRKSAIKSGAVFPAPLPTALFDTADELLLPRTIALI